MHTAMLPCTRMHARTQEGVAAFLKAGDPPRAIQCCIQLNQWDQVRARARPRCMPITHLDARQALHLHGLIMPAGRGHCGSLPCPALHAKGACLLCVACCRGPPLAGTGRHCAKCVV